MVGFVLAYDICKFQSVLRYSLWIFLPNWLATLFLIHAKEENEQRDTNREWRDNEMFSNRIRFFPLSFFDCVRERVSSILLSSSFLRCVFLKWAVERMLKTGKAAFFHIMLILFWPCTNTYSLGGLTASLIDIYTKQEVFFVSSGHPIGWQSMKFLLSKYETESKCSNDLIQQHFERFSSVETELETWHQWSIYAL